jgi:hypothetical protein
LEDWKAAEHARGCLITRDDGMLDAEAGQAVARLQSARAAPDDDDRVVAGREGRVTHGPFCEQVAFTGREKRASQGRRERS